MTTATPIVTSIPRRTARNWITTLLVLFKARVVMLLLFAALGGAMLGSAGIPTLGDLGLLMLTGGLSASGASALNQYIERHKDHVMKRTRRRPLVEGTVHPRVVLVAATAMIVAASGIAWLAGNPALVIWLAAGAFIYVGVYTIWLKPRSVLNVVIGGAAGSAAVLSGGAATGDWADPGVILLSLLLFTWSPTHFWSLALAYRTDYARANVPMLPVIASPRRAVFWMLLHAAATALFGLLIALDPAMGWGYLLPVGVATLWLLRESARLITDYSGARALTVFKVSNVYLSIVLLAICLAAVL
ncbi:MAG: protoheme IX farnesyltransferase [Anaerolineae bacterium]|nr:protoheme IX farnesyltransferase [Anaerolineae bacterium]